MRGSLVMPMLWATVFYATFLHQPVQLDPMPVAAAVSTNDPAPANDPAAVPVADPASMTAPPVPEVATEPHRDQGVRFEQAGDRLMIHFDPENGGRLEDFLVFSAEHLDAPITYNPAEVGEIRVRFAGSPSCDREEFRRLFDMILKRSSFLSFDSDPSGDRCIAVERIPIEGRPTMMLPHEFLPVEALDTEPERVLAQYTTCFYLEHADARAMMATLQTLLDNNYESLRNVEHSNALIAKASLHHLRELRDVIAVLDVPDRGVPARLQLENNVKELTERLSAVEARLDAFGEALSPDR